MVEEIKIYNLYQEEKIDFIKNKTHALDNISLNDVKQIESDFFNNVYVLLNNGEYYVNGKIKDYDIKEIYFLDGLNVFRITSDNKIISSEELENGELDKYLYNNGCSYKKIVSSTLFLTALTDDGRIIATHSDPTGIGIVPENFMEVEDICNINDEPYIIKNNHTKPLYIKH